MRISYANQGLVPDYASLAAELDATADALRRAGDRGLAERIHYHAKRLRWGSAASEDEPVLPRGH